jgi:hypothetical protein
VLRFIIDPAIILRDKNVYIIIVSSMDKLFLSGEGAIRILKVGDSIFPCPFDNGLMEETGIPIPRNRPVLFVSLPVKSFFFGEYHLMLVDKVLLNTGIFLVGRTHLELENLILNGFKLIRVFRFGFAPPSQGFGKVESLKMEREIRRFMPAVLGNVIIVILKKPPVFKFEWFLALARPGIEDCQNGSMVTLHHRQVINHSTRKGCTLRGALPNILISSSFHLIKNMDVDCEAFYSSANHLHKK